MEKKMRHIAMLLALSLYLPPCVRAARPGGEPAQVGSALPMDIVLATPEGESLGLSGALRGRAYGLVLLLRAWDGRSRRLRDLAARFFHSFRGRIRPVVVFSGTPRAVANAFMKELTALPYLVDEKGFLADAARAPVLPYCLLLSDSGRILWTSTAPGEETFRRMAQNPGRFLRRARRRAETGLPVHEARPYFGPWGPPEPEDPILQGDVARDGPPAVAGGRSGPRTGDAR